MGLFTKKEKRHSVENPDNALNVSGILELIGLSNTSASGEKITIDRALSIPAYWAGVNFLSSTIAGLPLNVYRRNKDGRKKVKGGLSSILHDAVNDGMSSFEWRKYSFDRVFTGGRSFTLIDRNSSGVITDLYPLIPEYMKVKTKGGARFYRYNPPGEKPTTYKASEIIDVPFMLKSNGVDCYSPVLTNKDTFGLSLSVSKYGSKFFNDGGVPAFAISGPFQTSKAMNNASEDLSTAIKQANTEKRLVLPIPKDHTITQLGSDPDKTQLVAIKKYQNEEIARILSLPLVFIQDLTNGTYANTEQQDLHLVKHTVKRWIEQLEQELNLKLFGRDNKTLFVEFNLDGLLRGDFKTRMEGYSKGIQNAILTPNEVRRKENLPDYDAGDELMIQGATVPIGTQPNLKSEVTP